MAKKILLADDSITIQKVIELTFSDEDFDVVTVGNGRLAIDKVQEVQPDIVLCDIIMPEKDGYEVCDFVKKNPALRHIPVLLLTGAFEPFDQERAARVGCDGFLAKPFEPQTLIAKVKDLLNQAAARQPAPPGPTPVADSFAAQPTQPFVAPAVPRAQPYPPAPPLATPLPPPARPPASPAAPPALVPDFEMPVFEPASFEAMEPSSPPTSEEPATFEIAAQPYEYAAVPDSEAVLLVPDEFAEAPSPPASPAASETDDLYGAMDAFEEGPVEMFAASPPPDAAAPAPASMPLGGIPEEEPVPWGQPTVEVPLEARAKAARESAQAEIPVFEEVFEDEPVPAAPQSRFVAPPPTPPSKAPAARAVPSVFPSLPASPPVEPRPTPAARAAVPAPEPALVPDASFGDISLPPQAIPPAAGEPSVAAGVSVPLDLVAQIAQRVVAQISEKVVREVAWEVIPELAETLIKKEIERLTAELRQT